MSYEIVGSVAEGATQGLLNWGTERVKELASKFRHGKLAFIQDQKTIALVKEQYKSGELAVYQYYIKDREMLFLLKMGLTMRVLDKEKDEDRRSKLRDKVFSRYKIKGLHIAQFVENGLLNRYIGIIIENISSMDKFKQDIMDILENIEKHVIFVRVADVDREIIKNSVTLTVSRSPAIFIVSGMGPAAAIVKRCENNLRAALKDYDLEKLSSGTKENLFFKRILRM